LRKENIRINTSHKKDLLLTQHQTEEELQIEDLELEALDANLQLVLADNGKTPYRVMKKQATLLSPKEERQLTSELWETKLDLLILLVRQQSFVRYLESIVEEINACKVSQKRSKLYYRHFVRKKKLKLSADRYIELLSSLLTAYYDVSTRGNSFSKIKVLELREILSEIDFSWPTFRKNGIMTTSTVNLKMPQGRKVQANSLLVKIQLLINRLSSANMRLVINIANGLNRSNGNTNGDEVRIAAMSGYIGLRRGIDRFNPTLGFRLTTYVTHWIRQEIKRENNHATRTIRLPEHMEEKVSAYLRLTELFPEKMNDRLWLTEKLDVSEKKLKTIEMLLSNNLTMSLDLPIKNTDGETDLSLLDLVDSGKETQEEILIANERTNSIYNLVRENLNPREWFIISNRYGFDGNDEHTLDEVGKALGVTRESIRQLQYNTQKKLRRLIEHYLPDLI